MLKIKITDTINNCYGIYSDQNKKIKEKANNSFYDNSEDCLVFVNMQRYENEDYCESDLDCDELIEEMPEE